MCLLWQTIAASASSKARILYQCAWNHIYIVATERGSYPGWLNVLFLLRKYILELICRIIIEDARTQPTMNGHFARVSMETCPFSGRTNDQLIKIKWTKSIYKIKLSYVIVATIVFRQLIMALWSLWFVNRADSVEQLVKQPDVQFELAWMFE